MIRIHPSGQVNAPLAQLVEQRTCIRGVNHDKNRDYIKWVKIFPEVRILDIVQCAGCWFDSDTGLSNTDSL